MPMPLVEPRPVLPPERFGAPEEAQEASYLAASARMRSFAASFGSIADVHHMFWSPTILAAVTAALPLHPSLGHQPALGLVRTAGTPSPSLFTTRGWGGGVANGLKRT